MSQSRDEYLCGVGESGHARLAAINAANHEHVISLFRKFNFAPGMLVLDIACGTGEITCMMAALYPDIQITAIDASPQQIAFAKVQADKLNLRNITYLVMSAYDLDQFLKRDRFDRIFIRWVLGHLKYPQQVIQACKTFIKPDGIIICEEGNLNTHHCQSSNSSFQDTYGFFVSTVQTMQKKRGIDPDIGVKLATLFKNTFKDSASIEVIEHQLLLADKAKKAAVSTAFLHEVGQRLIDEAVLTANELENLREKLQCIVNDDESVIAYTTDTAAIVRLT